MNILEKIDKPDKLRFLKICIHCDHYLPKYHMCLVALNMGNFENADCSTFLDKCFGLARKELKPI